MRKKEIWVGKEEENEGRYFGRKKDNIFSKEKCQVACIYIDY